MSSTIAKIFVAALAVGVAQALPATTSSAVAPPASSSAAAAPAPAANNDALIASLETAPTSIDRFKKLLVGADGKLLSGDDLRKQVVFDFNGASAAPGSKGGKVAAANIKNFPILTEQSIATTVAFLGPCGMNTPHIHPRAAEFLTVVDGEIDFGFILENGLVDPSAGSSEVTGHLNKFQGTVFPQGSIHYQVNPGCAPATFVATLNSEDPGTSQIAQNFFGLNGDVVSATLGFPSSFDGKDLESFRKMIPANLALGVEQCLKRCGIPKA
jgi:oxalate decarboxylase/phosphoglucose isomerase-like protein (cupin superfamily)